MKIGVVSSGFEMLPLFQVLSKYDQQYHLFWDWKYWPWGDKSPELRTERVREGMNQLREQGVEKCILPPVCELAALHDAASEFSEEEKKCIVPLFTRYLEEYVFAYSLVGKLGLLIESADRDYGQQLIQQLASTYTLSGTQQQTQKFNAKFPCRQQNVRMWTYFLSTYGKRDWMVRKTIKYDLRPLRDAAIDTLVPLSRGYLFYEKIIRSRTNWKKIRLHGLGCVEKILVDELGLDQPDALGYGVRTHTTDTLDRLHEQKKWMWVLERGKDS